MGPGTKNSLADEPCFTNVVTSGPPVLDPLRLMPAVASPCEGSVARVAIWNIANGGCRFFRFTGCTFSGGEFSRLSLCSTCDHVFELQAVLCNNSFHFNNDLVTRLFESIADLPFNTHYY